MTVVLDDHLLRDWLADPDPALVHAVGGDRLATTNLWYVRLCKSAARATASPALRDWPPEERRVLVAGLVALPQELTVLPLAGLAWRMGELAAAHRGLSTLGAEAVAATAELGGRLLVSSRDDGPGIRACCAHLGLPYTALPR